MTQVISCYAKTLHKCAILKQIASDTKETTVYDQSLNPEVNKTPPDPRNLKPGQKIEYGRKSTANEKAAKSLADQQKYTQETSARYGLPSTEDDWLAEAVGMSGSLYWEGGGNNGLTLPDPKRKTRPVLTKILRKIMTGEAKCLAVYSLDRLWRSVSICQGILTILFDHECLLFDSNGPVNIWTYEGRNAILQNAIASQAVSEAARINSPRGVLENLKNGVLATSPNLLGFRTAGRGSKQVKHMGDEQDLANRLYRLAGAGQSDEQIAHLMMAEGIQPYSGSGGKHPCGHDRAPGNEMVWRTSTVHDILRCPKYVGMQRHRTKAQKDRGEQGTDYPCAAFLREVERDGQLVQETVVPRDLWDRVQAQKDGQARIGHRGVNFRALSSLVRCGVEGEALTAQQTRMKDGSMVGYWIMRKTRPGCRCRCSVPNVREDTLMDYLYRVLGPLMHAEIRARLDSAPFDPHALKRAKLQQELDQTVKYRNGRLREMMRDDAMDEDLVREEASDNKLTIARLEREIAALMVSRPTAVELESLDVLTDLRNTEEGVVRAAVRQCVCWIAVLPVDGPREPKPGYKDGHDDIRYSYAPRIVAKLVFLTSYGCYHTAILCRNRTGTESGYPPFTLRPATPAEAVGGVADFPQAQCFVDGLTRAWSGRAYDWTPEKFAPGWSADESAPMPVAEFDWDGSPEA